MHITHNTMQDTVRAQSAQILNQHLAAAIDLHAQLKHAHWNVRGPGFIGVHELFDRAATALNAAADTIAERTAALGGTAFGTVQIATENSFLVPYTLAIGSTAEHCFAIAAALAAFAQSTGRAIGQCTDFGDAVTADLFTKLSADLDQLLWLIESNAPPRHNQ